MSLKNSKKTIQDKALAQMRKTRAALEADHPELIKALRMLVARSQPQEATLTQEKQDFPEEEETVFIDRRKNIEAVMKYAALNPGSDKLRAQLKEFIN
jgi:hypothetical protein